MRPLFPALLSALAVAGGAVAPAASAAPKPAVPDAAGVLGAETPVLSPVLGRLNVQLGVADQKPALFSDARFRQLNVKYVRRAIAWDTFDYDWQVREVDDYLLRARAAGLQPLVAFDKSRIGERRNVKPSRDQLRRVFAQFRARYPWITDFAAWNEPNIGGQWPFRVPAELGRVYKDMRIACPTCRIAAGDLVDYPNMVKFARSVARGAGEEPKLWGVHNYVSANRYDASRTIALLRAVKGDLWLTEVGGLVARRSVNDTHIPEGIPHAAKVTSFIFDGLARLDARIKRVYLYHWNEDPATPSWDSGLIDGQGRARPAFAMVRPALTASPSRRGAFLGSMLAGVRLGMTPAQAQRAAGRPTRKKDVKANPKKRIPATSTWTYRSLTVSFTAGRVSGVETTSAAYKTPAGTGVGSTAAQVAYAHLPKNSASACGRRTCLVGVREKGGVVSEFTLDARKRVKSLRIRVVS